MSRYCKGLLIGIAAICMMPVGAFAQTTVATASAQPNKQADELVFAVNRRPEPVFQTGRSAEVITSEEIRRRNVRTLTDVLEGRAGIFLYSPTAVWRTAEIRGMQGENIMVMVDGVRVNNATWGSSTKDYLDLIDISEVERVEIVRGAVGVLGTESSAGIINIITRKAPANAAESASGDVGVIANSGDRSTSIPVSLVGRMGRLRYSAGGTLTQAKDLRAGGSAGRQPNSDSGTRAAHLGFQFALNPDKTLSALFQTSTHQNRKRARSMATTHLFYGDDPVELNFGTIGYSDLSERFFADSIQVHLFWDQQHDGRNEIRLSSPTSKTISRDDDTVVGLSSELTKFVGAHQFVYGLDYSQDKISSKVVLLNVTTSVATPGTGRFMDGARYRNFGVYVNDRFDIGSRLSASVGTRFGGFSAKGERTYAVGPVALDDSNAGLSGSAGVVFHATKSVNVVANYVHALRSPNVRDTTSLIGSTPANTVMIPASTIGFERLRSAELGVKFQTERLLGSVFYFQNRWSDQVVFGPSTYNGRTFFDQNGNGVQDTKEPTIYRPVNAGRSETHGAELSSRFIVTPSVTIEGNVTRTIGNDQRAGTPLQRMPPTYGALITRWNGSQPRWMPWAEVAYRYASDQTRLSPGDIADNRIGPNGTPGYGVFDLRGGLSVTPQLLISLGVENVANELYKEHGSFLYRPGRSFTLGTHWRF